MKHWIRLFLMAILLWLPASSFSQTLGQLNTGNVGSYQINDRHYVSHRQGKYNLAFKAADLKETLRFIAKAADINMLIPEEMAGGTVTVNLSSIDLLDAIGVILRTNGLDYVVEGNIVRVGRAEEFKTDEDLLTSTVRLKYATAKELVAPVKELLSQKGKVISDDRTNTITIKDIPISVEVVKQMIQVIDIQDAQVLIQAKIVQVNTDFLRDIGIQWGAGNTGFGDKVQTTGLGTSIGKTDSGTGLNVNLPASSATSGIGLLLGRFANFQVDMQLTAAEQAGDIRIVSKPSIVTSNGKAANIRSGETLLIKTLGSTAGQAGELKEIKTGVELQVTPQISIDNQVKLTISATTSLADFSRLVDGIPIIIDNQASTTVLVRDGETTVIGGLLQLQKQKGKKSVPYLSRIPLLGGLFRQKLRKDKDVELMVFIKPTIIRRMPVKMGYPYPEDPEHAAEPNAWASHSMVEDSMKKKKKPKKDSSTTTTTYQRRHKYLRD
ncbi:MAG: hypothetical protein HYU97_12215 [Deltaproteobacteria bacterium]|nr:hypothetical protein [Deltaproteobacteria bacterium]